MDIKDTGTPRSGRAFSSETPRVVHVHDGYRGPQGLPGEAGPEGPPGDDLNVRGPWLNEAVYCPLDAVTARSSAAEGIQSLFVQRSSVPCSLSTVEPRLAPQRWDEIGATDLSNVTGAIWEIHQIDHGFQYVSQPVSFSFQAGRWVLADARFNDETAIALVREVVDSDRAILQSSGEIPFIDNRVIFPDGSDWERGRLYYVSAVRGRLTRGPLEDPNQPVQIRSVLHPILVPTAFHTQTEPDPTTGANVGVVLPWAPTLYEPEYRVVGQLKFYFTATDGQTTISGADLQGETLAYQAGPNTDVFLNGVNLSELDDYIATDGLSVTFPQPLREGDYVEVWTPDSPLAAVLPATAVKLDSLEAMFDDFRTTFPLTFDGGAPIAAATPVSLRIYHDGNAQEPFFDYNIDTSGSPTQIVFAAPPRLGDSFWGVAYIPVTEEAP